MNRSSIGSSTRWINRKICIWLAVFPMLCKSCKVLDTCRGSNINLPENATEDLGILTFWHARCILQPVLLDFFSFWSLLSYVNRLLFGGIERRSLCCLRFVEQYGIAAETRFIWPHENLYAGKMTLWNGGKGDTMPFSRFYLRKRCRDPYPYRS